MSQLKGEQQFDESAAYWADQFAIMNDIAQCNDAARIYLSGKFAGDGDNYRIRIALYESAFISFRRALKNGSSRIPGDGRGTWKFPSGDLADLIAGNEAEYKEILRIADKCIAHRASPEAGWAEVVKNHPVGEPALQIKYTERRDLISKLIVISERIKNYLGTLILKKAKEN